MIRYGFYGEVLLYAILHHIYGANPIILRGYFYNPLKNGVPNKIIEYYDNEEQRDRIRKQFDAHEEEKFKKIEAILD